LTRALSKNGAYSIKPLSERIEPTFKHSHSHAKNNLCRSGSSINQLSESFGSCSEWALFKPIRAGLYQPPSKEGERAAKVILAVGEAAHNGHLYWLLGISVLKNEGRTTFFDWSPLQLSEGLCVHF
jgi:hypothetical protein